MHGTSPRLADPAEAFTSVEAAALVYAVAVHDEIDLTAELPDTIGLDYDPILLERCYWLSFRLWDEVDRKALAALAARLARAGRLDPADAQAFKDIRARAKQLRFVFVTLGASHSYPPLLNRLTRLMGDAQDSLRSGRRRRAAAVGVVLRLAVMIWPWSVIRRELRAFTVTDAAGFRTFVVAQIEELKQVLALEAVSNKSFHDTRKIVSRLVATYDTFTVLDPSHQHHAIDRYLSTINGIMGRLHDRMAPLKIADRKAYMRRAERMPDDVTMRLVELADRFRCYT